MIDELTVWLAKETPVHSDFVSYIDNAGELGIRLELIEDLILLAVDEDVESQNFLNELQVLDTCSEYEYEIAKGGITETKSERTEEQKRVIKSVLSTDYLAS